MLTEMYAFVGYSVLRPVVEKPVENVENSMPSSPFSRNFPIHWGKISCISCCIREDFCGFTKIMFLLEPVFFITWISQIVSIERKKEQKIFFFFKSLKNFCAVFTKLPLYEFFPKGDNTCNMSFAGGFMQGKVEICGVNTANLKTLSQTQMDGLLLRARQGDDEARQMLIEGNLRLVLSVIQRFEKRGESPDDLFQVGCIGLMKAIANFDPTKGVRFSTYGVPMIAGEVRRYLRDNSAIRVSRSLRDVAYRVLQCKEAMVLKMGRDPTNAEVAKELELGESEVAEALDAVCAPVSLYDPVYAEGGDPLTILDQVRDQKNIEGNWIDQICLQTAFTGLSPREKQILSLRFYDGKTQMEVASSLGISQAQVSRLEKGAIKTMRKSFSLS